MSLPSEQIATLCVLHLMRHLFREFVDDIHKEADKKYSQEKDMNVDLAQDVKIPAVTLFDQLGSLFDKELKQRITNNK